MDSRRRLTGWTPDRVAQLVGAIFFVLAVVLLLTPALAPYPAQQAPISRGILAKSFDNVASVIILRIALAAVGGFVAGAFVQRLLHADFAIKIGPSGLELTDLSASTTGSLSHLDHSIKRIEHRMNSSVENLELRVEKLEDSIEHSADPADRGGML